MGASQRCGRNCGRIAALRCVLCCPAAGFTLSVGWRGLYSVRRMLSVACCPLSVVRCPSHANLSHTHRSAEDAVYVKKMASFYKRAKSEEEKLEARMVAAMARFAHVASRSGPASYSGPVPQR